MSFAWYDAAGALGVACIVGSYLALQLERLDARGLAYSSVNALGAALVLVSLCFEFNASAAAVEGFWLAISLVGMAKAARRAEPGRR
jgi:hypothetical protein